MLIRRLRVEEGFFDGLDITFSEGLNVLIGGRGVGKTSLIELVRFGLGIPGLTKTSDDEARQHALAVLQSGQVIIDLEVDGSVFTVTRSANEQAPRSQSPFIPPIIFSQKEIESVGLDADGRLKLIDSFIDSNTKAADEIAYIRSEINSITFSISHLLKEMEELGHGLNDIDNLKSEEENLIKQQETLGAENKLIGDHQKELNKIQDELNKLTIDRENISGFSEYLNEWALNLESLLTIPRAPQISFRPAKEPLEKMASELDKDSEVIQKLIQKKPKYDKQFELITSGLDTEILTLENSARTLRTTIEKHQEGAGEVSRNLGKVREKIAQRDNLEKIRNERNDKLNELFDQTNQRLEKISQIKSELFNQRKSIVAKLNDTLGPTIQVKAEHQTRIADYEESLLNTLRGSGLKYNDIVSEIAEKISPQELFLLSYNSDYQEASNILGIAKDRAARLVGYLREVDLGKVVTADTKDDVTFTLLDGSSYKKISDLSIGQRCTIALSVVLENEERILLVDQPEDHLDNEFIADTLIKALRQRADKIQSIVSSHNANIPVLGKANLVIRLDSNGRRGFVSANGDVDSTSIKDSILSLMEGGAAAFKARSEFYEGNEEID